MQNGIEIDGGSPSDIAASIARLITDGQLAPGERLPTVRALAAQLGVSPATVSQAWQALSRAGLIVSRGRAGSFVRRADASWLPPRTQGLAGHLGPTRLDLSRGTPDPLLLPRLGRALARVSAIADTPSYHDLPVIPELERVLRDGWPYEAEAITVVDGALDAVSRALEASVRFGDRVAVEVPGFPPFFDLLDALGASRVPVAVDAEGVTPESLSAALGQKPRVVLLQPRAQNPTGASMTAGRAERLARLLATHPNGGDVLVIEDDHSGQISTSADVSLGRWLPDRVLHVRSFSKSHGPDLRIAAIGGPAQVVDPIVARRMLGPGWTSRMLQRILVDLLTDGESMDEVAEATRQYYARQRALAAALEGFGVEPTRSDGINTWLPVHDERSALVQLAAAGIRVAPGSPFLAADGGAGGSAFVPGAFVRVTVGMMREDASGVAAALAAAALPHPPGVYSLEHRWA
ncbi:aminotransferase class I/II-fold pyridoxal phosphate-dependent enzyme [Agromyces larvae]|uniref:Aminotransferase class I/II-fold pyridoxal phosphate-dependent enzyme n=1 Tax=Agromyces larvae TaxID=2929802 RepID=A0ABY4BZK4_9MICO|nr:aminotransferase class I/II-fold pyridoxal phosphate-dependent enzyme [Agromyces larvae]UOE43153.1 aminotransferase class I/II-fold pyridoxal phosphate-dependent enzyme [Agromyces larvae]